MAAWLAHLASEYAAATASTYAAGLRRFRRYLDGAGVPLSQAAPADVRAFRDAARREEGISPRSVSTWLSAVRRFYAWLVEQGLPIANPASDVAGPRGASARRQHKRSELTRAEVLRLFEACQGDTGVRDRAVFALMAYCALRQIEIARADLESLDVRDGRQILWVHGKGRADAGAFVVLPAPAEVHLGEWLKLRGDRAGPLFTSQSRRNPGERLGTRSLRRMWLVRKRGAGISGSAKTLHSLRHSAITQAIRAGGEPMAVQAMARHQSFDTTLGYYHELARTDHPAEDLIRYGGAGEAGQVVLPGF